MTPSARLSSPLATLLVATLLLAGCTAPIGADRVSRRQAYAQVEANALSTGKPSAGTVSILHRYELDKLAHHQPDEAVRRLHQAALASRERALLFALAELSCVAGDHLSRIITPWDRRDPRDFYLGSAVYAWLFLFGDGRDAPPDPFDRRFRDACDLYNYGLGLGLLTPGTTNASIRLENGPRRLPVGSLELRVDRSRLPSGPSAVQEFLLADQFRVRGLSVRNRQAGIGTPLIGTRPVIPELGLRPSLPATALLRGPQRLEQLGTDALPCPLELHAAPDFAVVAGNRTVPLEFDLTAHRAYTLNQSRVWKLGFLSFLDPARDVPNQLLLHDPFEPDRIPVVFIHGTFSSPVTWAEMANTLAADPELRRRYQVWSFLYGSGSPLAVSLANLRSALASTVEALDPAQTNTALRRMVVIGHSQGGLLAKGTAVETGDRLWSVVSTNRLEDLDLPPAERERIERLIFLEPLPFVSRVVFIATPHRGSYLSNNLARRLARSLVSLPGNVLSRGAELVQLFQGSPMSHFLENRVATSLDGMSPSNPALLAMAEIPVAPPITAHSIIPVRGNDAPTRNGRDGVVAYASAHVPYVESEFIVRSGHSCLNHPATIEEVRRILHAHLRATR